MKRDGACNSLWQDTTEDHKTTNKETGPDSIFDVIIAGAGITGITTGLLLQKAGKKILIVEAQTACFGTTGGTTAHLNTFLDTSYKTIQTKFGKTDALLVAEAVSQAMSLIHHNIKEYAIDCEYKQLTGYLFSQNEQQTKELEEIYQSAQECNVDCSRATSMPAAMTFDKIVSFPNQASFHPTRYVMGLLKAFEEAGGLLLENCRITAVEEGEICLVSSTRGAWQSSYFIYATHIPPGVNLLHFRCTPYRSYAMAVELLKKEDYPKALMYDMYDPYHYYRTQQIDGRDYFIAGGEDHKTGHEENTEACFARLEAHIKKYFPVNKIVNRWSSQYFEPADGLPYIGQLPGHAGNTYVATGFGGNGMIYSAIAAMTLKDLITTGNSSYEEVFDPSRIKLLAGFNNLVKEAADVVGHLISKTFIPSEKLKELAGIANGEGRVVKYEGETLALYKDENGKVYALKAACTHIKCEVAWNSAEKSWDCPCHGSRFNYNGEMLTAPARKDLVEIVIQQTVPEEQKY